MAYRTYPRRSAAEFLRADRTRFGAFLLFIVLIFLTGGGSRPDIQSLVVLRPVALLMAAYALTVIDRDQLASIRAPLLMLLALLAVMLAQLVPLPPKLWAALPGRELYAELTAAAGVADRWRPLSLAPSRTINSIFSLSVPIAAVLLFGLLERRSWRPALVALVALAVFSSLWGLLQLMGSPTGPLYLYRITNEGLPVGLFANRNHQAVLLAAFVPVVAHLALSGAPAQGTPRLGQAAAWLAMLILVPTVLMTGSRAGLIALALALAAAALIFYVSRREDHSGRGKALSPARVAWAGAGALGLIALAIAAVMWFGRALAVERLMGEDALEDLRAQLVDALVAMIWSFFPVGSGFGSFDAVYDPFEPTSTLTDLYLNNAHSDWLQLLIEGGLPAGLLLLAFILWLGRHAAAAVRGGAGDRTGATLRLAALSFIAVQGAASIVDYPLRVPSIMAAFAIFCAVLSRSGDARVTRRKDASAGERG